MAEDVATGEALRSNEVVHADNAGELPEMIRILSERTLSSINGDRDSFSALSGLFGVKDVLKLLSFLFFLLFVLLFLVLPIPDVIDV